MTLEWLHLACLSPAWDQEQTVSCSDSSERCKSNQPIFRNTIVNQTYQDCNTKLRKPELRKLKLKEQTQTTRSVLERKVSCGYADEVALAEE